jgi:hypothetical protein
MDDPIAPRNALPIYDEQPILVASNPLLGDFGKFDQLADFGGMGKPPKALPFPPIFLKQGKRYGGKNSTCGVCQSEKNCSSRGIALNSFVNFPRLATGRPSSRDGVQWTTSAGSGFRVPTSSIDPKKAVTKSPSTSITATTRQQVGRGPKNSI